MCVCVYVKVCLFAWHVHGPVFCRADTHLWRTRSEIKWWMRCEQTYILPPNFRWLRIIRHIVHFVLIRWNNFMFHFWFFPSKLTFHTPPHTMNKKQSRIGIFPSAFSVVCRTSVKKKLNILVPSTHSNTHTHTQFRICISLIRWICITNLQIEILYV